MEALGLDMADGILLAYAGAKQECHVRRQENHDSQKLDNEQCSLTRAAKCHRKHVVSDDELRIYKPGIFGVFCHVPVNKLARNVVVVKRNEIPR